MHILRSLAVFMSVAESGSFSDAARRLSVSPAAISQSIARLEQDLGVRLFNRTTRNLTLTEDGRALYEQCKTPIAQLSSAISGTREHNDEPAGTLRVSLPNAFGQNFVLPLIHEFNQRYPKIKLFLGMGDHFSDLIEDGYDIGIRIGMLPDSRMSAHPLAPIPQYVVATPQYWREHGKPETIRDLLNHNCVNYQFPTSGRTYKWEFERDGERVPQEVRGSVTVNEIAGVTSLVLSGLGVGQLPGFEVIEYIRSGELEPVLVDFVSSHRLITICFPHPDDLPLRAEIFVKFLTEKLQNHPDIVAELPKKYQSKKSKK
ncbi:LysR family transcriptional regulator [Neisseria sp. Ec49-e6-T10]|uniref:LysR family transcriptional regulator n=1 Tax=Neisseria sp. Ec49-e6-T10 TaxID=3140744 RepID=UPI003EC0E131